MIVAETIVMKWKMLIGMKIDMQGMMGNSRHLWEIKTNKQTKAKKISFAC